MTIVFVVVAASCREVWREEGKKKAKWEPEGRRCGPRRE
jgi:hypothetical protein